MKLQSILAWAAAHHATLTLACCLSMATVWSAPSARAQSKGADSVIVDMAQAFKAGDQKALSALLPASRGHALASWAAYWELKNRLGETSAAEVQAFFTQHANTYAEDRLRNDWLLLLGQRRDWAAFEAELPRFRMRDDREVACYAAAIAWVKTATDGSELVRRNWYGQRDADDGCALAADRLFEAKKLKADDIWLKARLGFEGNRLRAASRAVEIVSAESLPKVAESFNKPTVMLKRTAVAGKTSGELALLAIIRLATTDVDSAGAELTRIDAKLSPEQRSYGWGVVGKYSNLKLDDNATQYFANAKNEHLTDDLLGWQARAALRAGRWTTVQSSIEAMTASARQEAIWTYWHATAQTQSNPNAPTNPDSLRSLERIAGVRGFYELLAMDRLGKRISAPARPDTLTDIERDTARKHPGLQRALLLIALGLRAEGVREWNYTTNLEKPGGMTERELLAAAALACSAQVWDRCINTSERTKEAFDHEQRFPMPFKDAVLARSKDINLDPAYVYGLIRQESRFITDARSHVGASGLMQVMPATAKWTAKKIGLSGFKPSDINDKDTNIQIGTGYLKLVLDDMGGSEPLAAAAYNAGPGRPRNWRNGPVLDGAIWAENIPFSETRDYVKKVAANATLYAAIITGKPQSIRSRIGAVGPKGAAAPADNKELP